MKNKNFIKELLLIQDNLKEYLEAEGARELYSLCDEAYLSISNLIEEIKESEEWKIMKSS